MKKVACCLAWTLLIAAVSTHADEIHARHEVEWRMEIAERTRSALIHVPDAVDPSKPLPLVIVLHGGGGNAESAARQTGLSALADREQFIVAYPNGSSRLFSNRLLTWNAGTCCAYAQKNNVDDVGFIRALIQKLQSNYAIDPKRIYATGISNGGMMSYRLACEMSGVLAAIAPVAAVQIAPTCTPTQPVSVIHFHGTADENVPVDGGRGRKALNEDLRPPVAESIRFWAQHNACGPVIRSRQGKLHRDEYPHCAAGSAVEYYLITGGGHAWPGGEQMLKRLDKPSQEISASETLWDFFKAHPKP